LDLNFEGDQRDYTIIHSTGKTTGTFDSVSSSLAFLDPLLSYKLDEINLHLTRNNGCFSSVGSGGSPGAVSSSRATRHFHSLLVNSAGK